MSKTQSAPRSGRRARRSALLAFAIAAVGALGTAPQAGADFTTAKCGGQNTDANGASFAKGAQEVFNFSFKVNYCPGHKVSVAYNANGSGAGIKGAQLRSTTSRFWGSDDPPTPAQVALMNSGGKTKSGQRPVPTEPKATRGKSTSTRSPRARLPPLINLPTVATPKRWLTIPDRLGG